MRNKPPQLKKLPVLRSDRKAERLIATAEFEFKPKTERVNMRLSKDLLDSVKAHAAQVGISYQRYTRQALERAARSPDGAQRNPGLWPAPRS